MNLKEAFRFQNKLQQLMAEGEAIIGNEKNITRVTTTYLRNKAMAEAKNETLVDEPATEYAQQITEMVEFLLYLLSQREVLSAAIRAAKAALDTTLTAKLASTACASVWHGSLPIWQTFAARRCMCETAAAATVSTPRATRCSTTAIPSAPPPSTSTARGCAAPLPR